MTETLIPPLFLQEIELTLTGEIDKQKYHIYQSKYNLQTYIVYIGDGREQGIVFRSTTLERVTINVERFLTPRPSACL